VLAVVVRFPFATRPLGPAVPVDLDRSEEDDRLHRTQSQLMCRLLRLMLIRSPGRSFAFVGDGAYGMHEVARFAHRHRLDPVSKLHPEANPRAAAGFGLAKLPDPVRELLQVALAPAAL
jgi:hypothetical protein